MTCVYFSRLTLEALGTKRCQLIYLLSEYGRNTTAFKVQSKKEGREKKEKDRDTLKKKKKKVDDVKRKPLALGA